MKQHLSNTAKALRGLRVAAAALGLSVGLVFGAAADPSGSYGVFVGAVPTAIGNDTCLYFQSGPDEEPVPYTSNKGVMSAASEALCPRSSAPPNARSLCKSGGGIPQDTCREWYQKGGNGQPQDSTRLINLLKDKAVDDALKPVISKAFADPAISDPISLSGKKINVLLVLLGLVGVLWLVSRVPFVYSALRPLFDLLSGRSARQKLQEQESREEDQSRQAFLQEVDTRTGEMKIIYGNLATDAGRLEQGLHAARAALERAMEETNRVKGPLTIRSDDPAMAAFLEVLKTQPERDGPDAARSQLDHLIGLFAQHFALLLKTVIAPQDGNAPAIGVAKIDEIQLSLANLKSPRDVAALLRQIADDIDAQDTIKTDEIPAAPQTVSSPSVAPAPPGAADIAVVAPGWNRDHSAALVRAPSTVLQPRPPQAIEAPSEPELDTTSATAETDKLSEARQSPFNARAFPDALRVLLAQATGYLGSESELKNKIAALEKGPSVSASVVWQGGPPDAEPLARKVAATLESLRIGSFPDMSTAQRAIEAFVHEIFGVEVSVVIPHLKAQFRTDLHYRAVPPGASSSNEITKVIWAGLRRGDTIIFRSGVSCEPERF